MRIARTTGGVMEIWADTVEGLATGMGFAHACDRLVQMSVWRLFGQGRLSECLRAGDSYLRADMFSRLMGFARYAKVELARCTAASLVVANAYSQGVNGFLAAHGVPLELRLLGYRPEPWSAEDTLLVLKLMTYSLGNSQRQMEKFLISAICSGTSVPKLQQLFTPHLDGMNEELVSQIRRVKLWAPPLLDVALVARVPQVASSNNWAISPKRTVSGSALECHDPHLPCNILPQPWAELVTHLGDQYGIGVTVPGIPGFVMGRNNDVSKGFTYGFMDMMDYFLEECRNGQFLQDGRWLDFATRTEKIERRGKSPVEIVVRENGRGVLEANPTTARLPDGVHLCFGWAGCDRGSAETLEALHQSMQCTSVLEVQQVVRHAAISANWVIADRQGNIGYQQSGLLPNRPHSGLFPLPGWDKASTWMGYVHPDRLGTTINPPCGFIATANDELLGISGGLPGINLCMGSDRVNRINQILTSKSKLSVADMKSMQRDVYSTHAEKLMQVLRPLLPIDLPSSLILRDWDLCYDAASRGASLFDVVHRELLQEIFGKGMFGEQEWKSLAENTTLLASYSHYFDMQLISGSEGKWFGQEERDALVGRILRQVLAKHPPKCISPLCKEQSLLFQNIMSPGRFGRLFGLDRGPITLEGAPSSIQQCNVVRICGQRFAVAPSYRWISDLSRDSAETAIAGGPSGSFLSGYYFSEANHWLKHEYKRLSGTTVA